MARLSLDGKGVRTAEDRASLSLDACCCSHSRYAADPSHVEVEEPWALLVDVLVCGHRLAVLDGHGDQRNRRQLSGVFCALGVGLLATSFDFASYPVACLGGAGVGTLVRAVLLRIDGEGAE